MDFDFCDAEVQAILAEVNERIASGLRVEAVRGFRKMHRVALPELEIQGTVDPENLDPSRRRVAREHRPLGDYIRHEHAGRNEMHTVVRPREGAVDGAEVVTGQVSGPASSRKPKGE